MIWLSIITVYTLVLQQLWSVTADTRQRHHPLGPSHDEGVRTHSRNTHVKHVVIKDPSGHHEDKNHHDGSHNHHHHVHRKAGSHIHQPLFLQTVPGAVDNVVPQPNNTSTPAAVNTATPTTASGEQSNQATAAGVTAPQVTNQKTSPVAPDANTSTSVEHSNRNAQASVAEEKPTESNSTTDFICRYLWFFKADCNKPTTDETNSKKDVEQSENDAPKNQPISPVVSLDCKIYGTTVLSLSDFKDVEENGWILINDSNSPRITHNMQVNLDKPTHLQLKNVICNAATYEATIKLGVDSSGGFIIRGSEQSYIVFEMNTLSKTATLKSINGPYQDIISDVPCAQINSQFVQKIQIKDTGYKGEIEIFIDGNKVASVSNRPFETSGYFGLYISQGNATFGDISVIPLKE